MWCILSFYDIFYLPLMNSLNFNASRHFARYFFLSLFFSFVFFLFVFVLICRKHWELMRTKKCTHFSKMMESKRKKRERERKEEGIKKNNSFWCYNILCYYRALGISINLHTCNTYSSPSVCVCIGKRECEWVWICCSSSFLRCPRFLEQVDNQARANKHQNNSNDFHYTVEHLNAIYVQSIANFVESKRKNAEEQK